MTPEDLYGYMSLPRLEEILRGLDESIDEWQQDLEDPESNSAENEALFHVNKSKHLLEGLCNFAAYEFMYRDEEFRLVAAKHGIKVDDGKRSLKKSNRS
jgi:hypothetical protein